MSCLKFPPVWAWNPFNETAIADDHQLEDATYAVLRVVVGKFITEDVPALRAINSRLLDDYIADCQGGIDRWSKVIAKSGIAFQFKQPHKAFNRKIGEFAESHVSPAGELMGADAWAAGQSDWLCSDDDHNFINSLMQSCTAPGQYASWIAPPRVGINNQPKDFEYVRIEHS